MAGYALPYGLVRDRMKQRVTLLLLQKEMIQNFGCEVSWKPFHNSPLLSSSQFICQEYFCRSHPMLRKFKL